MSWVLTFVGISALVLLHEAGHFAVAKAVGMRVERFSLFFGPAVAKIKRGETEYRIGTIPLGGYVKISGMNPLEKMPEGEEHRGYYKQAVWKRVAVIAAGPAVNVIIAFVLLAGIFWLSDETARTDRLRVAAVEKGKPAYGVLRKGDVLLAIDGHRIDFNHETEKKSFATEISSHRCAGEQVQGCVGTTPAHFTILRGGRQLTLAITPRYDAKAKRALVGVQNEEVRHRVPFGSALSQSVQEMWLVTHTTVSHLGKLFTSSQARKEVHGIVGVSDVASQAFDFGVPQALWVLALLSLSLAVINLFPFLPLDGGHIFWAVAEKIRGRAIAFEVMERASMVGIALVLVVAVIGFTNDISSLSNGSLTLQR